MSDLSNWGQYGTLRSDRQYGEHIPLYCVNHPDLRWSTKNIAPIGARGIFFFDPGMNKDDPCGDNSQPECQCSFKDLRVLLPKD